MNMLKDNIYGLFIFFCSFSFAQKEANVWHFGEHAIVNFNDTSPKAFLFGSGLNTREGCATICDKTTGALLFYTDGTTVWDTTDQMLNGDALKGHFSSTQSAVIVPQPGNDSIYFIFTVDYRGSNNGLNYSEVNMKLNNGLGAVTSNKNIALLDSSTEKITAIYHQKAAIYGLWHMNGEQMCFMFT